MEEEELRQQLSQCRDLALAHLEQMRAILTRSAGTHYALCQQVDVATHN